MIHKQEARASCFPTLRRHAASNRHANRGQPRLSIVAAMSDDRSDVTNVLSIDVEDWFHAEVYSKVIPRATWPSLPLRVHKTTRALLALLAEANTRATFFVLGTIAERAPELVTEIASAGHEIASHGWSHRPIWEMSPTEFREEIVASRQLLQRISNQLVVGYRAPTFSITKRTLWALEELALAGYRYDSSIFPIRHDRYGIPDAPLTIHRGSSGLWEIPMSVVNVGPVRLPFGGGGYLRLYPLSMTKLATRHLNSDGNPVIVYVHPWEFDIEQPRPVVSRIARFRHTVNIKENATKLARLLAEFRFDTCAAALLRAGMPTGSIDRNSS
jgi:polysaccharide deacetylase family protein (PEP-CTERM system associated)